MADEKRAPEAWLWGGMRQRCSNPKHHKFPIYGGRGIAVCERWNSFASFIADMGPRPTSKHQIDRIDNDGNYEPGNCRWATAAEQGRNRRSTRFYTHDGVTLCVTDWASRAGIHWRTLFDRLDRGLSIGEALVYRHRSADARARRAA